RVAMASVGDASRPRRAQSLVAFALDLTERRLQRAVIVDVQRHIGFGIAAGRMQNNFPAAHPAFEGFVIPESPVDSCLARAESDLEGPNAPGGRIAAFVFAGATRQSGFGSDAGLGRRWRRNRRGPNALNRDPCLGSSGQIHLKLAIAV